MIRQVRPSDRHQIRDLWKRLFGDSESFMDFFFEKRFYPDFSACISEDGIIRSCLQSMPLKALVRQIPIPCAIVAGVSTDPEYKGRGYMTRTFSYYMNMISDCGVVLTPHTPASLPTFFSLGHFPVSDTMWLSMECTPPSPLPPDASVYKLADDTGSELFDAYRRFSRGYSGIIDRSLADFTLKLSDYASDRAFCVSLKSGGRVAGYCIFYDLGEDGIYGAEFAADSYGAGRGLVSSLISVADGRPLKIKMPPDSPIRIPGANVEIRPQGVMGVADVPAFLSMIGGKPEYSLEITDRIVSKNNGVFYLNGAPSHAPADIRLSAGRLVQWLVGYRSLEELASQNCADILNASAVSQLDRLFPKQICHIIDEY